MLLTVLLFFINFCQISFFQNRKILQLWICIKVMILWLLKISNFAASMWFSISMDRMYTVQCTYDFASFKIENRLPKFLTVYTGRKTVILQSIFWVHIHTATSAPNTLVRADKESTEKGGGGRPHTVLMKEGGIVKIAG